MTHDAASDFVSAYLRVNGYFMLRDLELHLRDDAAYRAVTDVDVVAIRHRTPSGPVHYRDTPGVVECLLADEVDPALGVATDRCDLIIGEVKRGKAEFNPALRDPRVLHGVFRRIGDVFGADDIDHVIDELAARGRVLTPGAQVRLVAFGHGGSVAHGMSVSLTHLVDWLSDALARHHGLYEVSRFSDPVLSLLALMSRLGVPLRTSSLSPSGNKRKEGN